MKFLAIYLSMMVGAVCSVLALTAMRRREKHNIGKLGWLFLVLLTPPIGLILFILFGGKRISAEHSKRGQVKLPKGPDKDNLDGPLAEIAEARGLPPPSSRNRFEWFTDPEGMEEALIALIESAKSRVFIHTFILVDDELSERLITMLAGKAREGMEVKLMIDGFGSFLFPDRKLHQLEDAGGKTTRFKPLSRLSRFAYSNFRNHRKLICVDGDRALIGGANLVQYEVTSQPDDDTWIDYVARVDGIAARQVEAIFVSDWNFATDDDLKVTDVIDEPSHSTKDDSSFDSPRTAESESTTAVQIIPIGPDGPDEILDDIWLTTIYRAKSRVWIMTPYFVPPPTAMGALMAAARRGVDVRVMCPLNSDIAPADLARHDYVEELSQAGSRILLYPDRMVHAKMILIDREVAFIGSANFDMRSFLLNYELTVAVFGEREVLQMAEWFENLSQNCVEGPIESTWQRRGLRVLTRVFAEEL